MTQPSEDQSWKDVAVSLERPYTDDSGEHVPVLLDITHDGQHIYAPKQDPDNALGNRLKRIFFERGADFFDKYHAGFSEEDTTDDTASRNEEVEEAASEHMMTVEELTKMREVVLPQLNESRGEMWFAQELLASLLASAPQPPGRSVPPETIPLTATIVSKPPPLPPFHVFNAQLVVGKKDEALRKAADTFTTAAERMESGRLRGEKYWVDALKLRRENWGLIPAPLPLGSATGKGADKTSKDFLVSFGLEESPAPFRRAAVGHMPKYDGSSSDADALVFPHRQGTRLRVCLTLTDTDGVHRQAFAYAKDRSVESLLLRSIREAQAEVVDQEIFSVLIREASSLATAHARVSERLITIEASQGMELKFELIESDDLGADASEYSDEALSAQCDLVLYSLHTLLVRAHSQLKDRRLGTVGASRAGPPPSSLPPPPVLQPVIDLLQYQAFCDRIHAQMERMAAALRTAGVEAVLRFDKVREGGKQLLAMLEGAPDAINRVGGEANLRIDNRRTLRFTMSSPSTLIVHLAQAVLVVPSVAELVRLLVDEVEGCLLARICELGRAVCERVNFSGTWFVDPGTSRSVGRWEGCVLNFRVHFAQDMAVGCTAFRLDRGSDRRNAQDAYDHASGSGLFEWVESVVDTAIKQT